jgi:hypothetical protein
MRFLAPDLRNNDRVWIGRWNALVASVVQFFFTHHQNLCAQRNGIGVVVIPARRYVDADDPCPSAIQRQRAWQGVAP